MKKLLIVILVWFIVAGFFYAAIWTHEKNTLSNCFLYTGFVAVAQIVLTCISYPITQELCRMKKIILLAFAALMMVGCDMTMDSLDIVNGSKFVVTSKTKKEQTYLYRLIKVGDSWYDYHYRDTTNFEVGDTLTIIVTSTRNVGKRNWKN